MVQAVTVQNPHIWGQIFNGQSNAQKYLRGFDNATSPKTPLDPVYGPLTSTFAESWFTGYRAVLHRLNLVMESSTVNGVVNIQTDTDGNFNFATRFSFQVGQMVMGSKLDFGEQGILLPGFDFRFTFTGFAGALDFDMTALLSRVPR